MFPTNRAHALDLYLVFMGRTHFEQRVGESIPQLLQVKVLNLQQWCTLNKMSLASTTNASLQNVGLTPPLPFLVHVWYFDMLLCNLKWTKTTLGLKFWKVTCLRHFLDRSLHEVCSIYIYLCLWENILIGNSYWLSCCEAWYSSGLEIPPFLFKVLGDLAFDKKNSVTYSSMVRNSYQSHMMILHVQNLLHMLLVPVLNLVKPCWPFLRILSWSQRSISRTRHLYMLLLHWKYAKTCFSFPPNKNTRRIYSVISL